jgi:adenosylcobinamide kinase / adenosylcobinamide-phosphate guanylyltransferase
MEKELTLVLGGARSGKSDYAQKKMVQSGKPVLFVATATAGDAEMKARIEAHQAGRPAGWTTLEAPRDVGEKIRATAFEGNVLLDCLTLLANNVLMTFPEPIDEVGYQAALDKEVNDILAAYHVYSGDWIMVSNEVGLGLVPPTPLGRIYRDGLGRMNQRVAAAADHVVFMVAGIPMQVK